MCSSWEGTLKYHFRLLFLCSLAVSVSPSTSSIFWLRKWKYEVQNWARHLSMFPWILHNYWRITLHEFSGVCFQFILAPFIQEVNWNESFCYCLSGNISRDFSQIFLCLEPNLDQKYLQTVLQNVMGVVQLIEYSCHRRNTFKLDCLPAQFSLKHSGDNTHAYTFLCINELLSQSVITLKIRTKSLNSTPSRRISPEVNWIRV